MKSMLNSSFFFLFLRKHEKKNSHNTFLMLDPRIQNLRLVSSLFGQKQRVSIVHEYDMKSLFPMLLKSHQHLHPLVEFNIPKQDVDVDNNLDIQL